jgi:hypothetical protein
MIHPDLLKNGFLTDFFPIDPIVKTYLESQNYQALDLYFKESLKKEGDFFKFLTKFFPVNFIEYIIAIREAPLDEDGIWHDDGSRLFGFSLSLNQNPSNIEGGELLFKLKNSDTLHQFPPQPFGIIIIFLTGIYGYEHKVCQVSKGKRTVIAGWGSNL